MKASRIQTALALLTLGGQALAGGGINGFYIDPGTTVAAGKTFEGKVSGSPGMCKVKLLLTGSKSPTINRIFDQIPVGTTVNWPTTGYPVPGGTLAPDTYSVTAVTADPSICPNESGNWSKPLIVTEPAGGVTALTINNTLLYVGGTLSVTTFGYNKCRYAFRLTDTATGALVLDTGVPGAPTASANGVRNIPLPTNFTGNLSVALYSPPPAEGSCEKTPPPITVSAVPKPISLSVASVMLRSKDPAHAAPPYPTNSPVLYNLSTGAWHPGCVLDVNISGPGGVQTVPGSLVFDFAGQEKEVKLTAGGNYILTLSPSASAPFEKRCTGGPISKSFSMVVEAPKYPTLIQPAFKPVPKLP